MAKKLVLGDIIEAYCSRCRLTLDVSISAMDGDTIKQVQCRTCNNFVDYRPPVSEDERKAKMLKKVMKMRRRKSPAPQVTKVRKPSEGLRDHSRGRPTSEVSAQQGPDESSDKLRTRWDDLTDTVDSTMCRPYSPERSYKEGDFILHKSYGMGYVEEATEKEMTVLFREGTFTLSYEQPREY